MSKEEKEKRLIKNKIANVLHYYRNCKDYESEIEKQVQLIFELIENIVKERLLT